MKIKLLIILLFLSISALGQSNPTIGQVFNTINDLKSKAGTEKAVSYVIGGTAVTDFRGAFYTWDSASTLSEDMTYYNVIKVNNVATGRWIRTNQSTQALTQGTLFRIGPFKFFSANGVTNANGEFVLNVTLDNTANGTAVFSSILFNSTMATSGSTSANDAVVGTVKTVTPKVITYRYTRGNTLGVGVVASVVAAGANVPIQCFIVGL